jgi:hypothetical protein
MKNLSLVAIAILVSGQLKATCGDDEAERLITYKLANGVFLERTPVRLVYSSRKSYHVEDFSFLTKGEYVIGQKLCFTIQSFTDGALITQDIELSVGMDIPAYRTAVSAIYSHTILHVSNSDADEWAANNFQPIAKLLEWLN